MESAISEAMAVAVHRPVAGIRLFNENAPDPFDRLRQDHSLLCGELAALKKAENSDGPPSLQALRDACARLSVGLREHIRREERLLVTHRSLGAAVSEAKNRSAGAHYSDYRYLQVIAHCVESENCQFFLNGRYKLLTNFLQGLRSRMDRQEAELFPSAEQAAA